MSKLAAAALAAALFAGGYAFASDFVSGADPVDGGETACCWGGGGWGNRGGGWGGGWGGGRRGGGYGPYNGGCYYGPYQGE